MKYDSKNINQANNSIFKQLDTNIIFDYQKNNMMTELIPNQDIYSNYKTNIYKNKNLQIYLNGTTEPDENVNFMKTQRNKFSNISNKPNYHSNVNTTKNRGGLNRYNSYKRIATTNINNNALFNLPKNNKIIKNKKTNGGSKNKLISHNNSKGHNNTHIHNNQKMPFSNNKKSIIPLGNNKYKTIGDNSYYSNVSNRMHNDININNYNNRLNHNERQNHNTIDMNELLTNHNNNINKKYNMKKYNSNNNSNLNKNKQMKKTNYNYNHNHNNYRNVDIRRNGSNIRPKTPDNNKRGKTYSRFNNNNNMNNQRTKTPDRQRSKMKLNLTRDYLNTIDNNKITKTAQHYNYVIRDYNHTIDNSNSNNGKYKYSANRLNTNDYFKLNKKTINNYDDRQNMTITNNNNTITTNNSNSRKNFYGKIFNERIQAKPQKRLSKNSSQGNILGHNNYNINLNSNGINHIYKNINENYILKNYHSNINTNLITPIKYINQKSNFKNENIQLTQLRPPNNYNLYNETFQSFGTNLPILTNNEDLVSKRNNNNLNENNNYFEMKLRLENAKEISKNNDYGFNNKTNYDYNYNMFKELYQKNKNSEKDNTQIKLKERNGNSNNNNYIPATINNTANKTYSFFNNIKNKNKNKVKENEKNDTEQNNNLNDIDFNDLDQFSPPYTKEQLDLNKNIDEYFKNQNKYMNIGCIEERNKNYETVNYDCTFGANRKVIDDFINQLKSNV